MRNKAIMLTTVDPEGHAIMQKALGKVAGEIPEIDAVGTHVILSVPSLGILSWRELAAKVYALADDQGVVDRCFPLSVVKEDGER